MTTVNEITIFLLVFIMPASAYGFASLLGVADWAKVPPTTSGLIRVIASFVVPAAFWALMLYMNWLDYVFLGLVAFVILSMFITIVFGSGKL